MAIGRKLGNKIDATKAKFKIAGPIFDLTLIQ
jgi:hypothetical protein